MKTKLCISQTVANFHLVEYLSISLFLHVCLEGLDLQINRDFQIISPGHLLSFLTILFEQQPADMFLLPEKDFFQKVSSVTLSEVAVTENNIIQAY